MEDLDDRKILLAESIDSGEFFLAQLRQKVSVLQNKRNNLKATLNSLESEERSLKVKHSKLNGLSISQYVRNCFMSEQTLGISNCKGSLIRFEANSRRQRSCCGSRDLRKRRNVRNWRWKSKPSSVSVV
jgi:hypothetical protein